MRRKISNKLPVPLDPRENSLRVAKFINRVMWDGKKETARKIVYGAFDILAEKTGASAVEVFEIAITNATPLIEVRSRRIGGANYQVPREVRKERGQMLAFKWIIESARGKKGEAMHKKLAAELLSASKSEGAAVKKREDTHRMADANKAFAHLAW
jgi:small subunit ribosomal protein S7